MKTAFIVSGALAALIAMNQGALSAPNRDAQTDRLTVAGMSLLDQRVPVPKIRVPGPRAAEQGAILLAQATDPRITQLEEQIRQLNGLVEELNFQVLQMQDQIRKMQEDNEFRFQELEKRADGGTVAAPRDSAGVDEIIEGGGEVASADDAPATLPRNLGNVTFDKDGNVVNSQIDNNGLPGVESGQPGPDNTQVAALPATSDPDELYRNAYEFVLSGDYDTAEAGFRQHIERFPSDARTADAHFWLGEALLGQQKHREAAQVFLAANRDFPDSRKAPEMMLKLGVALAAMDQRDVACATLGEVKNRYPQASAAVLERAKLERTRASC